MLIIAVTSSFTIELHVESGKITGVKCKRAVLSTDQKLGIIEMLKTSSQNVVVEKFGVRKSTVTAIKKNEAKLLAFKSATINKGMNRQAKVMCLGDST